MRILISLLLSIVILLLPVLNRAGAEGETVVPVVHDLYTRLGLPGIGLSEEVFRLALRGHDRLREEGRLVNPDILTIADLSQSSCSKRLYVIDLRKTLVLFNTYVAHGRNTGEEFARSFSNAAGSLKSSLGFFITGQTITSGVGFALMLEGVERGFNDNARRREIIMHGAAYATETFIRRTGRLGRSFGCPSLPPELIKPVANAIRNGSCLFIYHRDQGYLSRSSLLN